MDHSLRAKKSYADISRETPSPHEAWRDDKLIGGKKSERPLDAPECDDEEAEEEKYDNKES
jgi:hypothetical protein